MVENAMYVWQLDIFFLSLQDKDRNTIITFRNKK